MKALECLPNKLTPLYSEIHYKEENYLKVKTALFKYITPPYSKGWYIRYITDPVDPQILYFKTNYVT